MKRLILLVGLLMLLTLDVYATELPDDLKDALPESAEELMKDEKNLDFSDADGLTEGIALILKHLQNQFGDILRQRLQGAVSVLLVVVLCAALENTGGKQPLFLSMAGALSITVLTAGSLDMLIGLGAETIQELNLFSKALLPTLAAATAASGAITTATFQQVSTVFFADLLMNLINGLLMPMVYIYIGAMTAGACMSESRLWTIAEGLKKAITWILTSSLLLFTVYLSVVRVISGAVDGTTVKVAKTAISGVVPVVGGIIAEASETVLLGAGMLRNTIGIFGMLAILAACAYPFLQLGIQYLLYKLTAFLAGTLGTPGLCKLVDGLGGAFGLVLGMTGGCALLLLISVYSSVAAVMP